MNEVRIDGVVVRDPEAKQAGNHTVSKFTLAHKDERGMSTSFFDVEAWNDLSTQALRLKKGSRATVEGTLKQDAWEATDGTKKSRVKVIAKKITPEQQDTSSAPLGKKEDVYAREMWP